mmetsp:Transcript_66388/g.100082  ORF Transcript_66388/g.100082 Transcript_66388/m.100082 type:complete len:106 (-) Transcript_66388:90-407(-)
MDVLDWSAVQYATRVCVFDMVFALVGGETATLQHSAILSFGVPEKLKSFPLARRPSVPKEERLGADVFFSSKCIIFPGCRPCLSECQDRKRVLPIYSASNILRTI